MKNRDSQKGFTLVEILIVISIISILFLILIPQVNSYFAKTNETSIRTDFRDFQQSSESYLRETLGIDIQVISLNQFMDSKHAISNNGGLNQTKGEDPWGNPYEVNFGSKKITFASYGEKEDPSYKKYTITTYIYKGVIDSCTYGFANGDITLSKITNLPTDFVCGDDITLTSSPPTSTLSVPSNFITTSIGTTNIDLSWGSVTGATGYILKRGNSIIYTGNNRTFSDIALTVDSTYTYSVAATNGSETSTYATLSAKTNSAPPPTPPTTPTNFIANNITTSSVSLSWNSVSGATSYELKRGGVVIYTGTNTTYTNSGLNANTTYTYSLVAKNSSGSSGVTTKTIKTQIASSTGDFLVKDFYIAYSGAFYAIKEDDTLWSWGLNMWGELGIGNSSIPILTTPTKVGTSSNWREIFTGNGSVAAIKNDGTLWTWGDNEYGQLGLGDYNNRNIPTKVGTDTDWESVTFGNDNVVAIKSNGTLWIWGDNSSYLLGQDGNLDKTIPTKLGSDTDWKKVSISYSNVFALKNDGTLWTWGDNTYGQLGLGDYNDRTTPTKVGTNIWLDFFYAGESTIALKNDGTLWSWGNNEYGQLGHNNYNNKNIPTKIGTGTDWKSIETSGFFFVVAKNNGTFWTWGYNEYEMFGFGSDTDVTKPTQVEVSADWKKLVGTSALNIGIKNDGTLWSSGNNEFGQLGLGDYNDRSVSTQIGTDTDWKDFISFGLFTVATKNDGTLWSWGDNRMGILGLGDDNIRNVPTKITPK